MTPPADQRRSELVEIVGRAIATAYIKEYADDAIWAEDRDIYQRRYERDIHATGDSDNAFALADTILTALEAAGVDLEGWQEMPDESDIYDGRDVLVSGLVGNSGPERWVTVAHFDGENWLQHEADSSIPLYPPTHYRLLPTPPKDKP